MHDDGQHEEQDGERGDRPGPLERARRRQTSTAVTTIPASDRHSAIHVRSRPTVLEVQAEVAG